VKYSLQLPTDRVERSDEFLRLDRIAKVARGIEDAGFDACYVTEHPIPGDEWLRGGGHHSLDPFVALTAVAAATQTLRLHTNLIVLPYRNPFLTAKSIASLDVVSEGRVIMGVGAGYMEDEYEALGADFANRNALTDEAIATMKKAWSGSSVTAKGMAFEALHNTALPAPFQHPHPPLWIGGNSPRAIRRAAELGQGWSPFPLPRSHAGRVRTSAIETIDDLAQKIRQYRELARTAGREDIVDVNFVPFGHGMNSQQPLIASEFREQVVALEAAGVTWLSLGLPGLDPKSYLESILTFGKEIIA
jgi:probable F420-dependent oxidoreductase